MGASSRRGRRRESCRCSRSGVEDPTDGNARRNSGVLEGAGAPASLRDLLPLHQRLPRARHPRPRPRRAALHPRRASPMMPPGTFQSVATTLFDTARLDLRPSTRHLLSPLSLLNPARGCIRALRQHNVSQRLYTWFTEPWVVAPRVLKLALYYPNRVSKFHFGYLRYRCSPQSDALLFIIIAFSRNRSADFAKDKCYTDNAAFARSVGTDFTSEIYITLRHSQ